MSNQNLLLTEAYEANQTQPHDSGWRNPSLDTSSRHVVLLNGDIRFTASEVKKSDNQIKVSPKDQDAYSVLQSIFDDCASQLPQGTYANPSFSAYVREAVSPKQVDAGVVRGIECEGRGALKTRIVAVFSDASVANTFAEKVAERTMYGRVGNVELEQRVYHVRPADVQDVEAMQSAPRRLSIAS